MTRQYIGVRFRPRGQLYTYHNDGDPVAVGDRVKINGRDGWQSLEVATVSDQAPRFETKPILGPAPLDTEKLSGKAADRVVIDDPNDYREVGKEPWRLALDEDGGFD